MEKLKKGWKIGKVGTDEKSKSIVMYGVTVGKVGKSENPKCIVTDEVKIGKVGKSQNSKTDEDRKDQDEEKLRKSIIKGLARHNREPTGMCVTSFVCQSLVFPCAGALPMGFSWSPFFAQNVDNCTVNILPNRRFRCHERSERPLLDLPLAECVIGSVYIDNLWILSLDLQRVRACGRCVIRI